jgi:hypothetical protein
MPVQGKPRQHRHVFHHVVIHTSFSTSMSSCYPPLATLVESCLLCHSAATSSSHIITSDLLVSLGLKKNLWKRSKEAYEIVDMPILMLHWLSIIDVYNYNNSYNIPISSIIDMSSESVNQNPIYSFSTYEK